MAAELSEQFRIRSDILLQAVHILIEHIITEGDKAEFDKAKKTFLHTDVDEIYQRFEQSIALISNFKDGLNLFYDLLKQFIDFLETELFLEKKVIYKAICQAEQFAVWQKGRSELMTESKIFRMNVRQFDVPILKLADSQKLEYLGIVQNNLPPWYLSLSDWQQRFIKKQLTEAEGVEIEKYLLTVPAGLRQIPGLANYSLHVLQLLTKEGDLLSDSYRFCTAFPSVLSVENKSERRRLTNQNINQIYEQPLNEFGKRFLNYWNPIVESGQILDVPILVQSLLSPLRSDNLLDFFRKIPSESRMIRDKEFAIRVVKDKLESKRGVVEIRHKKIKYRLNPIIISTNYPINALREETLLIRNRMEHNSYNGVLLIYCVSNFIRDVILSKLAGLGYVEKESKSIGQTDFKWMLERMKAPSLESEDILTEENLNEEGPYIKQCTYHVDLFKKLVLKTFDKIIRRNSLFLTLTPTVKLFGRSLRIFQHELNECLNALNIKRLAKAMPEDAAFIEAKLNRSQIYNLKLLLNAIKDYIVLYNTARRSKRHKEMFLSSLEEIVTEKIGGISCSASKMSRDRKGMQTLHTDAMLIYHRQFGVLPTYNDSRINRKRFVEIFADLFLSGHQQKHAGQNMPGSEGIKDITLLPFLNGLYMVSRDILREINSRDPKAIKKGIQFASLTYLANPYSVINNLLRWITDWLNKFYREVG